MLEKFSRFTAAKRVVYLLKRQQEKVARWRFARGTNAMDYVFSASEKGNFSFAQILLRRYIILITRTYRNLQRRSHNDTNVCDVTVCFRSYRNCGGNKVAKKYVQFAFQRGSTIGSYSELVQSRNVIGERRLEHYASRCGLRLMEFKAGWLARSNKLNGSCWMGWGKRGATMHNSKERLFRRV